ncbi:MAG TPA: hypothetical protein VK943_10055 [Arenibaculum sp.]|nr:hypothetical protein [Arenibaculum sp.]
MATYKYTDPIHSVPLNELLSKPVEFWPSGKGFDFNGMQPPVNTAVDYDRVQQGLNNVGLSCSQNNRQTIDQVIGNVRNSCPTGGYGMRMSTEANPPSWHWTIEQQVSWSSFMDVCLAKHAVITEKQLYPVYHKQVQKSNSQSTVIILNDLFEDIAKIAADLAQGSVDTTQMVKSISEQVAGLATKTSSTYHVDVDDQTTFFVSQEMGADNQASAIAGSIYKYTIDIKDYKNKKSETHDFSYSVEQWSLIFTDSDVFTNLYNEVKNL